MTSTGTREVDHDLPLGHLTTCQICGSSALAPVLDLGHMPPCDSLLDADALLEAETVYPLRFLRCTECGLAQIDYVVAPEILFHPSYPYISGITPTLVANLQGTAAATVARFGIEAGSLAIDIGSNDGTLLQGFKSAGMRVLGVEATNVARIAEQNGIPTLQAFFDEDVARGVRDEHGPAAAITATNMFAHVQRLGSLLRGVTHLLTEGGVFVTESHYLLDLLETTQYDSIYHEHLKFYSMRPLLRLFEAHGFSVVDVERIPNYGGSIRVYAVKGQAEARSTVPDLLAEEERFGLYDGAVFDSFARRVAKSKLDLLEFVTAAAARGETVAGIGCPGRASTLLNHCGIDPDLMPYIAEQSTSLKLGLHLPGTHIPVVDEQVLFAEPPAHAVMLSWHYFEPIVAKLRQRGLVANVVLPLPEVRSLGRG